MMTSDVLITHMPATRRRILIALKERGGMTADELAENLGISSVAVRRHLTNLERDRLVDHKQVQRGMGRPSYVYRLTEAAHQMTSNPLPPGDQKPGTVGLEAAEPVNGSAHEHAAQVAEMLRGNFTVRDLWEHNDVGSFGKEFSV